MLSLQSLRRQLFSTVNITPGAIVIGSFAAFKPVVSRVVLRVHPDVLVGAGLDVAGARANETSLVSLLKLVEGVRARCGEGGGKISGALAGSYDLSFWHAPPKSPPGAALIRTRHAVLLSTARESALDALAKGGRTAEARALWLTLALSALRPLAEATGSVPRGGLVLSQQLQVVADRDAQAKTNSSTTDAAAASEASRAAWKPESVDASLRAFLLANPPLQQGKSGLGGLEEGGIVTGSVFSAKQRRARAESLLARDGWLTVDPQAAAFAHKNNFAAAALPGASLAAAHLRHTLTLYHDAMHLYHPLWDGARVSLEGVGSWGVDVTLRSLRIPCNFEPIEMVRFVRKAWPAMLQAALRDAARGRGGGKKPSG